ncbi:MAG TPA: hypothetical protein VFH85_02135 [Gammaproteobacteria bacterium]|nr:hypothetical protein [Gammaproteobacteria bacterium]
MQTLPQQTTHRARYGYPETVTGYVRTDTGAAKLASRALCAEVRGWGKDDVIATLDASGTDDGEVTISVPAEPERIERGLYRIDVLADGEPIYIAALEMV